MDNQIHDYLTENLKSYDAMVKYLAFVISDQISENRKVDFDSFENQNQPIFKKLEVFNNDELYSEFMRKTFDFLINHGLIVQPEKKAENDKVNESGHFDSKSTIDSKKANLPRPTRMNDYFLKIAPPSVFDKSWNRKKNDDIENNFGFYNLRLTNKQNKSKEEKKKIFNREKFESDEWQKHSKEIILTNWIKNPNAAYSDIIVANYNMNTIDGSTRLLESTTIKLIKGMKYGLVGLNGVGKTTLLKRISRYDIEGIPKTTKILYVEQEIKGDETTVIDYVLKADAIREYLLNRREHLNEKLKNKDLEDRENLESDLNEIELKIGEFEIDSSLARACKILSGLGFSTEMQSIKTKYLSGGWRMRVSLASALFVSPDLLLLDEPTNHLDFPSVLWLENYLKNYKNTVVIVSHDRHFLNNVITHVVHMYHQKLDYYKGDYSMFERVFKEHLTNHQKAYESQRDQIKHIQDFIDKFRYNAKRASLVQSRIKTLRNMEKIKPIETDKKFKMNFPKIERVDGHLITLDDVVFGYSEDKILLRNINFVIDCYSRIGLMGPNGVGKSTLLKLIMGFYQPIRGRVVVNRSSSKISYFTQHHIDSFDLEKSPLENVLKMFEDDIPLHVTDSRDYCSNRLYQFGISRDMAMQKMKYLSGGEKSRVAFCTLVWKKPHLLILDEPTNHLDMETIDVLIEAIGEYKGGLLIVSHDQYFLSKVAKDFWAMKDGMLKTFDSLEKIKNFVLQ